MAEPTVLESLIVFELGLLTGLCTRTNSRSLRASSSRSCADARASGAACPLCPACEVQTRLDERYPVHFAPLGEMLCGHLGVPVEHGVRALGPVAICTLPRGHLPDHRFEELKPVSYMGAGVGHG